MDREQLLGIYFTMNKIRKFEEKALHLFESNKLRGSVHLCIGQEATPATVCSMLRDEDYITSTHRGHGHCIAKGADVTFEHWEGGHEWAFWDRSLSRAFELFFS